jgi:hypothetical protein
LSFAGPFLLRGTQGANLMQPHGGLQFSGAAGPNTTGQVYGGVASTFAKVLNWTGLQDDNSQPNQGDVSITPDLANNRLMVEPGIYRLMFQASILGNSTAQLLEFRVYKNGIAHATLRGKCSLTADTTEKTVVIEGILKVNSGDVVNFNVPNSTVTGGTGQGVPQTINASPIEVWTQSSQATQTVVFEYGSLTLTRLDP